MTDHREAGTAELNSISGAVSDDAIRHLQIRDGLNHAIYAAIRRYRMSNMADEDGYSYPLVDLMSNPAPADIGTGEMEMIALADEVAEAVRLALLRPASGSVEREWPDIGPDPFQGPRENDNHVEAHKRLRDAYAKQQPIVPNQTALVWRIDIGRVHMRLVQLEALFAERHKPIAPPAETGEKG